MVEKQMTSIERSEAMSCTYQVKEPYRWINRGLTVTRQGQCGMFDVLFVKEPGYEDTPVGDVRVFSEV